MDNEDLYSAQDSDDEIPVQRKETPASPLSLPTPQRLFPVSSPKFNSPLERVRTEEIQNISSAVASRSPKFLPESPPNTAISPRTPPNKIIKSTISPISSPKSQSTSSINSSPQKSAGRDQPRRSSYHFGPGHSAKFVSAEACMLVTDSNISPKQISQSPLSQSPPPHLQIEAPAQRVWETFPPPPQFNPILRRRDSIARQVPPPPSTQEDSWETFPLRPHLSPRHSNYVAPQLPPPLPMLQRAIFSVKQAASKGGRRLCNLILYVVALVSFLFIVIPYKMGLAELTFLQWVCTRCYEALKDLSRPCTTKFSNFAAKSFENGFLAKVNKFTHKLKIPSVASTYRNSWMFYPSLFMLVYLSFAEYTVSIDTPSRSLCVKTGICLPQPPFRTHPRASDEHPTLYEHLYNVSYTLLSTNILLDDIVTLHEDTQILSKTVSNYSALATSAQYQHIAKLNEEIDLHAFQLSSFLVTLANAQAAKLPPVKELKEAEQTFTSLVGEVNLPEWKLPKETLKSVERSLQHALDGNIDHCKDLHKYYLEGIAQTDMLEANLEDWFAVFAKNRQIFINQRVDTWEAFKKERKKTRKELEEKALWYQQTQSREEDWHANNVLFLEFFFIHAKDLAKYLRIQDKKLVWAIERTKELESRRWVQIYGGGHVWWKKWNLEMLQEDVEMWRESGLKRRADMF